MFAFAVVAGNEDFAGGHDDVDVAGGIGFRSVGFIDASGIVWVEGGVIVVWIGPDGENTVEDLDAFAWECNDALDDVLILDIGFGGAGEDVVIATVGEDDNLSALRDVFAS